MSVETMKHEYVQSFVSGEHRLFGISFCKRDTSKPSFFLFSTIAQQQEGTLRAAPALQVAKTSYEKDRDLFDHQKGGFIINGTFHRHTKCRAW